MGRVTTQPHIVQFNSLPVPLPWFQIFNMLIYSYFCLLPQGFLTSSLTIQPSPSRQTAFSSTQKPPRSYNNYASIPLDSRPPMLCLPPHKRQLHPLARRHAYRRTFPSHSFTNSYLPTPAMDPSPLPPASDRSARRHPRPRHQAAHSEQ